MRDLSLESGLMSVLVLHGQRWGLFIVADWYCPTISVALW